MTVTTTVEGRERYPVNIRYFRDFRSDLGPLKRVLVPTMSGAQIPLGQLVDLKLSTGTTMVRSEEGELAGYVYIDVTDRDIGGYVQDLKKIVAEKVQIPPGYHLVWSGQYEYMERAKERLKIVIPLTLLIVFVLLYFNTGHVGKVFIVLLAVPFSLIGAFWCIYLLGYHLSVAVWVGIIALAGVDAETGVIMLLYLDTAYEKWKGQGKMRTLEDLREAISEGAVKRIRPEDDDRDGDHHGSFADHVEPWRRSRCDETDRRAHDRRNHHFLRPGADRLPGDLRDLEGKGAAQNTAERGNERDEETRRMENYLGDRVHPCGLLFCAQPGWAQHQHGSHPSARARRPGKKKADSITGRRVFLRRIFLLDGSRQGFFRHHAHGRAQEDAPGDENESRGGSPGHPQYRVSLIDVRSNLPLNEAVVKMKVISPTGKEEVKILDHIPAMNQYSGDFALPEKGRYQILILFKSGEKSRLADFITG